MTAKEVLPAVATWGAFSSLLPKSRQYRSLKLTDQQHVQTELPSDELQDFETILRAHKRCPDEFEVSAYEAVRPIPEPISGSVTVLHRKSGTQRIYQTGSGTAWITAFNADLDANVF